MVAPSLRHIARVSLSIFAVGAVVGGIAITSIAAYSLLNSSGEAAVPSISSLHRSDPGTVYDRPLGQERVPYQMRIYGGGNSSAPGPPLANATYRLVIDRIGINASVYTFGLDANRVPEVPLNGSDVAWYNFSAQPGTGSNAVFAGHVTWGGQAVFYRLDEVQAGDLISLRGENGVELAYAVTESFLVDADDPNSLSVMSPTNKDVITLITCGGTYFRTGHPVFGGDYTHRLVVRAEFAGFAGAPAVAGG